jgi:omega-hydroxy-beta-dihydromenaquinone-9 sulfotransferase
MQSALRFGQWIDPFFFPSVRNPRIESPIVIAGLPRTGTTFLQRWLHAEGVGTGQELWRILCPSATLQAVARPLVPYLEPFSPTRHHPPEIHRSGLSEVEADDASLFLHHLDGFFLYGFLLAHADEDLREWIDSRVRDTSARDYAWLRRCWARNLASTGGTRVLAKLFSAGGDIPALLRAFPDARVIYTRRDPRECIPSAMSLLTSVLDAELGFHSLPKELQRRYLDRIYDALVELMRRFHQDWSSGAFPQEQVFLLPHQELRSDFSGTMHRLLEWLGHPVGSALEARIQVQASQQTSRASGHRYSLSEYGLDEAAILRDCAEWMQPSPPTG